MKKTLKVLILMTVLANLFGCAKTLPLVSHAHVGHALTTWHDTPDQVGLYVSAQHESREALKIASDNLNSNSSEQEYAIRKIAYILNPDVAFLDDADFGVRYGVIRALEGTLDHIEYAASSDDASLNLVSSINEITQKGELVINNFKKIFLDTQKNTNTPASLIAQLNNDLDLAVNGQTNGGLVTGYGIQDFTKEFNNMLKREHNPRYEPLPRRYVLGLVRLPNGHWGYKLNSGSSGFVNEGGNY